MATKTNTKTSTSRPANQKTLDVDEIAENATQTSSFLPIADFGGKLEQGKWRVVFLNPKPRQIEKEFDDGDPRLGIDVLKSRIVEGVAQGGEEETIFLRIPKDPSKKMGSLPNGILALYREHKGNLKDVTAVIRKRVYDHESWGETCAYDVNEVHDN